MALSDEYVYPTVSIPYTGIHHTLYPTSVIHVLSTLIFEMRRDLKYNCLCLDDVFPSKQPLPPIGETSERPATGRDIVRAGISGCLKRHHPPPFLT